VSEAKRQLIENKEVFPAQFHQVAREQKDVKNEG
jgi:hypothetical protein